MVRMPKYQPVDIDDVFSKDETDVIIKSVLVMEYAVFRQKHYQSLATLSHQHKSIILLIPDYPSKHNDLELVATDEDMYRRYIDGRFENMTKFEAFEAISEMLKPKTLYFDGDNLYLWKTKKLSSYP